MLCLDMHWTHRTRQCAESGLNFHVTGALPDATEYSITSTVYPGSHIHLSMLALFPGQAAGLPQTAMSGQDR